MVVLSVPSVFVFYKFTYLLSSIWFTVVYMILNVYIWTTGVLFYPVTAQDLNKDGVYSLKLMKRKSFHSRSENSSLSLSSSSSLSSYDESSEPFLSNSFISILNPIFFSKTPNSTKKKNEYNDQDEDDGIEITRNGDRDGDGDCAIDLPPTGDQVLLQQEEEEEEEEEGIGEEHYIPRYSLPAAIIQVTKSR